MQEWDPGILREWSLMSMTLHEITGVRGGGWVIQLWGGWVMQGWGWVIQVKQYFQTPPPTPA